MPGGDDGRDEADITAFIARWRVSEGAERAAYAQFLSELCRLIGVEAPQPPTSDATAVTYRFEYPVAFRDEAGIVSTGRIDLYKRGSFVLEAKQSRLKGQSKEVKLAGATPDEPARGPRGRRGADRAWDDLFGLSAEQVRERYPEVYQHVKRTVKEAKDGDGRVVGRDANRRDSYRQSWWLFGEPRRELRPALAPLQRYIVTVETAKHRVFQFLDTTIMPDNKLVAIGLSDAYALGVMSSRIHECWFLGSAGKLGVYERDAVYVKSRCFDPFPFPDASEPQKQAIRRPAEALDALRKRVLDEHPALTLTKLYDVREAILAGRALTRTEVQIRDDGLVLILNEHHDAIDRAVAAAYGWTVELAESDILGRLVALNAGRAREEARGQVRWLRPDYQRPRFARDGRGGEQIEATELAPAVAAPGRPAFPSEPVERVAAVLAALAAAATAMDASRIALAFSQGRRVERAVRDILVSLARVGEVATVDGGRSFSRRRLASG